MSKNHIWIGTFSSEKEFEKYIDQTAYFQAWNKYNNEPLDEGEENIEPSDELRCPFCKEIGMSAYDEDFLICHFEQSGDFNALLSRIPANLKRFLAACEEKGVRNGNTFFCYVAEEISKEEHPEKSKGMIYIGEFPESKPTPLVEDEASRLGLEDVVWVGNIFETREAFMQHFDQSEYMLQLSNKKKTKEPFSCDFCKNINIPYCLPENIQIYFADKPESAKSILTKAISNKKLLESVLSDIEDKFPADTKLNVVVHIVEHASKKEKEEPKVKIYPKELLGQYKTPKGYVEEKDSYNGLTYIGKFSWD